MPPSSVIPLKPRLLAIAGAMPIPTELRQAASVFRFNRRQRWTTVILPGIFPYLITGLVTASGGVRNANTVAVVRPL